MDILKEIGMEEEEEFTKIARDGAGLGIYLIFSAQSENGVRYGTLNNIKIKVAGYMYDASDITSLVGRGEYTLPDRKGRAMVKYKGINIMQIYTAVSFEDEITYMENLKEAVAQINDYYPGEHAPRIPVLPETLRYEQMEEYPETEIGADIMLGLDVEEVKRDGMMTTQSPFIIIGDSGRGKTNALKCILRQIAEGERLYLFDSRNRELNAYKNNSGVSYVQTEEEISEFVTEMQDIGNSREEEFTAALAENPELTMREFISRQSSVYVIVDGADEFVEKLNEEYEDEITGILEKAANMGVTIIMTVHSAKLHGYDDLTSWIKNANDGLVVGDQGNADIFPVSYQETIEFTRGLLFNNGVSKKIMIPEC